MREYRDAKSMAHMLREALAQRNCKISVGDSLELMAHLFGVADWNTLSAAIKNSDCEPHRSMMMREPPARGPMFSRQLEETLHRSLQLAGKRGHRETAEEHLLLSLTQDPDALAMMKACGVDPVFVSEWLARSLDAQGPNDSNGEAKPSAIVQHAVQRAILDSQASGEPTITGAHVLLALLSERESTAVRIVRMEGFDLSAARKFVRDRKGSWRF